MNDTLSPEASSFLLSGPRGCTAWPTLGVVAMLAGLVKAWHPSPTPRPAGMGVWGTHAHVAEKHPPHLRSWHHPGVWSMQIQASPPGAEPAGWVAFLGVYSVTNCCWPGEEELPQKHSVLPQGGAESVGKWGQPFSVRRRLGPGWSTRLGGTQALRVNSLEVHSSEPQLSITDGGSAARDQCVLSSPGGCP